MSACVCVREGGGSEKEGSHTEASFDHEKFHWTSNHGWYHSYLQVPIKKLHRSAFFVLALSLSLPPRSKRRIHIDFLKCWVLGDLDLFGVIWPDPKRNQIQRSDLIGAVLIRAAWQLGPNTHSPFVYLFPNPRQPITTVYDSKINSGPSNYCLFLEFVLVNNKLRIWFQKYN